MSLAQLQARLDEIAPERFSVHAPEPGLMNQFTPETRVRGQRPIASAQAVIFVSGNPEDYAVAFTAINALLNAPNYEVALTILEAHGSVLDVRLREGWPNQQSLVATKLRGR